MHLKYNFIMLLNSKQNFSLYLGRKIYIEIISSCFLICAHTWLGKRYVERWMDGHISANVFKSPSSTLNVHLLNYLNYNISFSDYPHWKTFISWLKCWGQPLTCKFAINVYYYYYYCNLFILKGKKSKTAALGKCSLIRYMSMWKNKSATIIHYEKPRNIGLNWNICRIIK